MIEITRSIHIAAPPATVAAQFGDVGHHATTGVHRGVSFRPVHDDGVRCEYEQVTAMGPIRSRQRLVLDRSDPARHQHRIVAGLFAGGTITFVFTPQGSGTCVTATVQAGPGSVRRRVARLLARVVGRSLERALEEDRADLESGAYSG